MASEETMEIFITTIEVALNIPSGHTEVNNWTRLQYILDAIRRLSHRANYQFSQQKIILDKLQDYMDAIQFDFEKQFEDDPEGYREGWDELRFLYTHRPRDGKR